MCIRDSPYWAKKAMEGHAEDISPCIRCNEGCLDRGNHLGKSINCTCLLYTSRCV